MNKKGEGYFVANLNAPPLIPRIVPGRKPPSAKMLKIENTSTRSPPSVSFL